MKYLTKFLVICNLKDPITLNYRTKYITMILVVCGLSLLFTVLAFNACNDFIEELVGVETFTKEEIEARNQLVSFYDELIGEISERCLLPLERTDYECLCLGAVVRDTPVETLMELSAEDIRNDRVSSISARRKDCEIAMKID